MISPIRYSPVWKAGRDSTDEGLLLDEQEALSEQETGCKTTSTTIKVLRLASPAILLALLVVAYYIGLCHGSTKFPVLPTYEITKHAHHLQLQMLDDEGEIRFPENEKFIGQPRPELDEAWNWLLNGFNIRVPHHLAEKTGFESIELADGTRDLWGTLTVLHNLHCLKKIREAIWADHYQVLPLRESNGTILAHTDHCIDNLRQSIMCNADLTLYHYYWQNDTVRPMPTVMSPHVCIDWTKLQDWLNQRKFSIYEEGLLVHPTYGPANAATWPE